MNNIKKILVPDYLQLVLELILSLITLTLLNAGTIKNYLTGINLIQPETQNIFNSEIQKISSHFDTLLGGRLPQTIFWAILGCLLYALVWFLSSIYVNIRNDVVIDEYVHPASFKESAYWQKVITDKLLLLSIGVIILGYTAVAVRLLSWVTDQSKTLFFSPSISAKVLHLAFAIVITIALFHILGVLLKIFLNAWRYIFS